MAPSASSADTTKPENRPALSYVISLDQENQIQIQGRLKNISKGRHTLSIADALGTTKLSLVEHVNFSSPAGRVKSKRVSDNEWMVTTEGSDISFSYTLGGLPSEFEGLDENVWASTLPRTGSDLMFLSRYAFLVPRKYDRATAITLDWNLPAEWNIVTPWNRGENLSIVPSMYSLLNNYYVAYKSASTVAVHFMETEFVIIWTGEDSITDYPEAIADLASVFHSAKQISQATAFDDRTVLLIHDSADPGEMTSATAGASTIQLTVPEGIDFNSLWSISSTRMLQTVAHELMHTSSYSHADESRARSELSDWKQDLCWLREGFTEYLAHTVLLDAEVTSIDGFVNQIQSSNEMSMHINSESLSLSSACQSFYEDRSAFLYTYYEGTVLAFILDMELRNASNGMTTLADFMRYFLTRYANEPKDLDHFMTAWTDFQSETEVDVFKLINQRGSVAPGYYLQKLGCVESELDNNRFRWFVPGRSKLRAYFANRL